MSSFLCTMWLCATSSIEYMPCTPAAERLLYVNQSFFYLYQYFQWQNHFFKFLTNGIEPQTFCY